jgi:hypothetical protein
VTEGHQYPSLRKYHWKAFTPLCYIKLLTSVLFASFSALKTEIMKCKLLTLLYQIAATSLQGFIAYMGKSIYGPTLTRLYYELM